MQVPPLLLQGVPGTFLEGRQRGEWKKHSYEAQPNCSTCLMPRYFLSGGLGIFIAKWS